MNWRFTRLENINAMATFQLIGKDIYRTNTYIQFGTSRKSLGSVVMLSPGSASLTGEAKRIFMHTGAYTDTIKLDNTMKQLVKFMKATHTHLDGRLYIYNLFYVKSTKHVEAIELFELLKAIGSYPTLTLPSFDEMKKHPWILIGWGIEKRKRWKFYELEKRKWLQLIKDSNIPYFGVLSKDNEYYHLSPNSSSKNQRFEQLIKAYKTELERQLFI